MKLTWMAAMTMAMMAGATARNIDTGTAHDLTIYVDGYIRVPPSAFAMGKGLASKMLRTAGVRVTWVLGPLPNGDARPEDAMVVRIESDSKDPRHAHALAFATPYEGSGITVLYSRMQWAEQIPGLTYKLFAHVLVHEITHNLQGVCRHSKSGIMKPNWTGDDFAGMGVKPLAFEPEDLELIELAFAARAARRTRP